MIRLIGASVCALLGCACSAAESGQGGDTIASVGEPLGEAACTAYPAPALGTTTSNIGYYNGFACPPATIDYQSPSYDYNPSGCPRQYILQLANPSPPLFGTSFHYWVTPKWIAQALDSTTCPQAHLAATVWKRFSFMGTRWEDAGQVTATGHWEGGTCVFRRDDNNSTSLSIDVIEFPYEDIVRIAVQAKRGSNYHTVGISVGQDCVR